MIALRLCASACIAANQTRERPDNAYLSVSQQAIRLKPTRRDSVQVGRGCISGCCRVAGVPASERVIVSRRMQDMVPVLGIDLRHEPAIVLDLSVDSPIIGGDEGTTRNRASPLAYSAPCAMRTFAWRSGATMSRDCSTLRRPSRWALG